MATVNISFDTKTKVCSASIDGVPFIDIDYISIYKSYEDDDKSSLSIVLKQEIEDEGITVYTNVNASEIDVENPIIKDLDEYPIIDKEKVLLGAYAMMGKKPPK